MVRMGCRCTRAATCVARRPGIRFTGTTVSAADCRWGGWGGEDQWLQGCWRPPDSPRWSCGRHGGCGAANPRRGTPASARPSAAAQWEPATGELMVSMQRGLRVRHIICNGCGKLTRLPDTLHDHASIPTLDAAGDITAIGSLASLSPVHAQRASVVWATRQTHFFAPSASPLLAPFPSLSPLIPNPPLTEFPSSCTECRMGRGCPWKPVCALSRVND